jgi:hypothetical protein
VNLWSILNGSVVCVVSLPLYALPSPLHISHLFLFLQLMQWQKRRRNCLEEEEFLSFQYQALSFMVKGGEVGFGKVFLTFLALSFISSYASPLLLPTFLLQFRESNLGNRNILGVLQKDSRELSPLTCFLPRSLWSHQNTCYLYCFPKILSLNSL